MRRIAIALVSLGVACGARSEIAGSDPFDEDGSVPVVTVDASPKPADATLPPIDAMIVDAAACSAPQVQIGGNGFGTACKANITWMCGDTTFRVGGGCDLPDADWPDADPVGAEGVCDVDGKQTTTFTTATCSCDPSDWIALAMMECPGSHQ